MGLREDALFSANRGLDGDYGDDEMRMRQIAYAQVMATLAVAEALDGILGHLEARTIKVSKETGGGPL